MSDVTRILSQIESGDPLAAEQLFPLVYEELRILAAQHMANEKPGQTLQATALVHEAFVRIVGQDGAIAFANRRHFFSAAAEAMRRVLVDAARRRLSEKRGGGRRRSIEVDQVAAPEASEDLVALHEALDKLNAMRPEVAELVKLRYFAGLTGKEAAECLGIAPRTADNYWAYAKAFLLKEIEST